MQGHDAELLRQAPAEGAWSALQCLSHLNITSETYLPLLTSALEKAPPASWRDRFGIGFLPRLLLWMLEPPYRQKTKTIPSWEPQAAGDPKSVFASFERLQGELLKVMGQFDGKALDQVTLVSPFDKRLKYNVLAAFRILAAHQRRHLWQAERALASRRPA